MKELKIRKKQIGTCFVTEEDYIVYKKVDTGDYRNGRRIKGLAIIWIPEGSKIVVSRKFKLRSKKHNSRKLRTDKAICIDVVPFEDRGRARPRKYLPYGNYLYRSSHSYIFSYEVGKVLEPSQSFSDDVWNDCRSGIHFFETSAQAETY